MSPRASRVSGEQRSVQSMSSRVRQAKPADEGSSLAKLRGGSLGRFATFGMTFMEGGFLRGPAAFGMLLDTKSSGRRIAVLAAFVLATCVRPRSLDAQTPARDSTPR